VGVADLVLQVRRPGKENKEPRDPGMTSNIVPSSIEPYGSVQHRRPPMHLLPRKGVLAIAAVLDIAMNARGRPVAARSLANRHRLPPRHLEPVLQALVREGILRGVRGPRGGYELARAETEIAAREILQAAGTVEEQNDAPISGSALLTHVVVPALAKAQEAFADALADITVADLARSAQAGRQALGEI